MILFSFHAQDIEIPAVPAEGSILTVYHPRCQKKPTLIKLSDYTHTQKIATFPRPSRQMSRPDPPIAPFTSRADFRFAAMVVKDHLSRESIQEHINLHQTSPQPAISFKSYTELESTLTIATARMTEVHNSKQAAYTQLQLTLSIV